MNLERIEVRDIQAWDANGQLFRAFDHLIARRSGGLLLVPIEIAIGSVQHVVDRCPVPVEEAVAIIDQRPLRNADEEPVECAAMTLLVRFAPPAEWEVDHIQLTPGAGRHSIRRLIHECGIRYAEPILDDTTATSK